MSVRMSIPSGVMVREIDGEAVLVSLNNGSYYGLDPVGTRMWATLTTSDSIQAAYEKLLGEYEVEPEKLLSDLDAFIEKLVAQGLLEVAHG
jgi:hypothetical protein